MSTNPNALIQQKMDVIDRRWRWLKFWEHIGAAGALFCLFWFALELCAWRKILTESWLFWLLVVVMVLGAVVAFVAICIAVTAAPSRRVWLANRLEKGCPGLLDRLNTLVFLKKMSRPYPFALKRKIEAQAAQVFEKSPIVMTLSSRLAWGRLGAFALMLAVVILFNRHYDPFEKLLHPPSTLSGPKNDTPFELVPANVTESKPAAKPWGEVHIVDPGHDMKLTKIDVLPLQIEMTASSPLQNPVWITSINGGPEVSHELPPPNEPQYAVYQPLIYLDELKVSDWDVVSYYAKAETNVPAEYASKIYFIEIRPFREDILKQAGGGGRDKNAHDLLNDLTGLITRQTTVIQQTHEFQQTTYPTDEMRKQDGKKLTDAEGGLSAAADHLYGKIVAENENAPIGDILDHLTQAEQQMDRATENLGEDIIPEAKQEEQGALTELVACRKSFLKVISKNPGAFGDGTSPDDADEPPVATAQDSLKALSQVTEMHDRAQSALKTLHQLNLRQHYLAHTPTADDPSTGHATAQSERNLKEDLDRLVQDNPDLFRAADAEKANLQSDMSQAIDNLDANETYQSKHYLSQAAGDMNDLEKTVQKNHQLQQLAEAYKLKKIIDQNIQQLGQEKNKPGTLSPQDLQALADSAKRSTGTLKEITDTPGNADFGPDLSKSLSPENQQALGQALDQLAKSEPGPESQGAAGAAQGNLANVSHAFEQAQPALTKQIHSHDQLQSSPSDALDQGTRQLQGLIMSQQQKQPPSNEEQRKELGEILGDLQDGLSKDKTPQAADILAQIQDMQKIKNGLPVDAAELKKLLDKIEMMSAEANDNNQDKPPGSEITVIDPSKFPANYRDRIRTYYEQLSTHDQ